MALFSSGGTTSSSNSWQQRDFVLKQAEQLKGLLP
jgi:hypothetical protein